MIRLIIDSCWGGVLELQPVPNDIHVWHFGSGELWMGALCTLSCTLLCFCEEVKTFPQASKVCFSATTLTSSLNWKKTKNLSHVSELLSDWSATGNWRIIQTNQGFYQQQSDPVGSAPIQTLRLPTCSASQNLQPFWILGAFSRTFIRLHYKNLP